MESIRNELLGLLVVPQALVKVPLATGVLWPCFQDSMELLFFIAKLRVCSGSYKILNKIQIFNNIEIK